jgi:hypothetical protein
MIRYQPVFLIDEGSYQVLVYDPDKKEDVLVKFGNSDSPGITMSLIEKDPKTTELRQKYLNTHTIINDPRNPKYWIARYVWGSGDPWDYYPAPNDKKNNTVEPFFPAQNAVDPSYNTVIVPGYAYGAPYTVYQSYPYYSTHHFGPGSLALAGLGGLALGALLF